MGNLTRRLGRIQVPKNDEVLITQWINPINNFDYFNKSSKNLSNR